MGATAFQRRRRELEAQVSVAADMTVMNPPAKKNAPAAPKPKTPKNSK